MTIQPEGVDPDARVLLGKLRHAEERLADVPADITAMYQERNPNWRAAGVSAVEHLDLAIIALNEIRATIANRLTPYDQRENVIPRSGWDPGNSGPGW